MVVLDTDIIVKASRSAKGGSNAVLGEAAHARLRPLVTTALLLEYEAILKRPEQRLAHRLGVRDIHHLLAALASAREAVEASFQWRRNCRTPMTKWFSKLRSMVASYPLAFPISIKEAPARLAKEDRVSLDQWIAVAIAQKIGVVETASDRR